MAMIWTGVQADAILDTCPVNRDIFMSPQTKEKFLEAGLSLYPQTGYEKLSVRALAAHAGLSAGLFHQLFANKDDFFRQLLQRHDSAFFREAGDDGHLPPEQALRAFMERFSQGLQADLPWNLRLLDDCAAGIAVVREYVKNGLGAHFAAIEALLRRCLPDDAEGDYLLRRKFLILTTIAPVLLGSRFAAMGILPLSDGQMKRTDADAAHRQWMDWVFAAVLGGNGG